MPEGRDALRAALEAEIRKRHDDGDIEGAASAGLRGYGPEILGFLHATLKNDADAADVFSAFCEGVWRSLPRFRWQCSFRTWAYTIARRETIRLIQSPIRRVGRNVPLDDCSAVMHIEAEVRSQTASFLRTDVKDRVAKIRDALDPEDRLLLILRVDKGLAWNEVAQVMLDDDDAPADRLKRESARLRKRFELVKAKILELGKREGQSGG
jgi:RNA polymerase sigma-70 factor (ECF subfamily)